MNSKVFRVVMTAFGPGVSFSKLIKPIWPFLLIAARKDSCPFLSIQQGFQSSCKNTDTLLHGKMLTCTRAWLKRVFSNTSLVSRMSYAKYQTIRTYQCCIWERLGTWKTFYDWVCQRLIRQVFFICKGTCSTRPFSININ